MSTMIGVLDFDLNNNTYPFFFIIYEFILIKIYSKIFFLYEFQA